MRRPPRGNPGMQGSLPPAARHLAGPASRPAVRPAGVLVILAFSIFPLLVSAYLALSRFQLGPVAIGCISAAQFREAALRQRAVSLPGRLRGHPLVRLAAAGAVGWFLGRALWLSARGRITAAGLLGRLIGAALLLAILLLFAATWGPVASSAPSG